MLKVGLTGGIGSGKSYVCDVFRALGVPVYEADVQAKNLMVNDEGLVSEIKAIFGKEAYINGQLNTKLLSSLVFKKAEELKKLNSIVHPAVQRDFRMWADNYRDKSYVIEEAAVLFESGSDKFMDRTIFVSAERELRISRVMKRSGMTRSEVEQRMKNQSSDREKEKLANFIVYNEIDSMIVPQIVDLHNILLKI